MKTARLSMDSLCSINGMNYMFGESFQDRPPTMDLVRRMFKNAKDYAQSFCPRVKGCGRSRWTVNRNMQKLRNMIEKKSHLLTPAKFQPSIVQRPLLTLKGVVDGVENTSYQLFEAGKTERGGLQTTTSWRKFKLRFFH